MSALNFNDEIFRLGHGEQSRAAMPFLGKLFLGIFVLVLVVAVLGRWLRPRRKSNVH